MRRTHCVGYFSGLLTPAVSQSPLRFWLIPSHGMLDEQGDDAIGARALDHKPPQVPRLPPPVRRKRRGGRRAFGLWVLWTSSVVNYERGISQRCNI